MLDPTLVFVGVDSREKFDKIAAPLVDHGQKDAGHVLTKSVEDAGTGVTVVFQFWVNNLKAECYRDLERVPA